MATTPFLHRSYRALSRLVEPGLPLLLRRRLQRGKEDGTRLPERLGHPGRPRPDGRLIWIHSASVGEMVSILPLIERLVAHGAVMLTTGTVTSAELAARRLPPGAFHQFIPVDAPGAVDRFMAHWRPDLGILCESEIWPNLVIAAHAQGVPMGIVNGRMSDRSFRRWSRLSGFIRPLLSPLAFCTAQSDADAARYRALGAPATSPGNLKFDVPPLPFGAEAREALRQAIGARPVIVAASTHPGEEEEILSAAEHVRTAIPDLLVILVPRHPKRGGEIATLLERRGERALLRSTGALPEQDAGVYVADTLGELGLFYGIGTLALIGGSWVEHGGHNPIEAIKRDCPAISGPHVANFRDIYADLLAAGGTEIVEKGAPLAAAMASLLASPAGLAELRASASNALRRHEGAVDRTMAVLDPLLRSGGPG